VRFCGIGQLTDEEQQPAAPTNLERRRKLQRLRVPSERAEALYFKLADPARAHACALFPPAYRQGLVAAQQESVVRRHGGDKPLAEAVLGKMRLKRRLPQCGVRIAKARQALQKPSNSFSRGRSSGALEFADALRNAHLPLGTPCFVQATNDAGLSMAAVPRA
jgi:hypothetical protein